MFFSKVAEDALQSTLLPAFTALVGHTGHVKIYNSESAKRLIDSDEAHGSEMRRRAASVGNSEKTMAFLEGMMSFHGGGGCEKKKRRMASQGVQSFAIAQKVEAAPLRELKQKIDGSDEDE